MAPRNSRVNPETEVRSPARSFLNSLDNFYAPSRDTRSEQATQQAFNTFSGILGEKADEMRKERRQDEYNQGIADAMREQAGQEMEGVKTGSIFRQHSKFYMAGLNETRGKAAAARFKQETTQAYQEWEGRHTDDDGSAFRAWMNERVANFMGTLGENQYQISGALPTINEMAHNFASQHTTFTTQRLQNESFEAYDEIVSGVFTDLANGEIDMEGAVALLGDEADDMYLTDGAAANDRVVDAAIRFANIHNDPDALIAMAKAHDSGRLKISQGNREKIANAMDAVEADIARETAKRNSRDDAEEKARRKAVLNAWGSALAEDPYAELPTFSEVGDAKTYREMVTLQEAFIKGHSTENPQITTQQRMGLEVDLYSASTAGEKISILSEFTKNNPTALSGADVAKYSKEIFASTDPGNLVNDPTVKQFRDAFGQTLGAFQKDDYDINTVSVLRTQGEVHYNRYLMAKAAEVDPSDPKALDAVIKEAEAYAMEQLAWRFPEILKERSEEKPDEAGVLGVGEALENRQEVLDAEAAAEFAAMAGVEPPRHGSEPEDIEAHGEYDMGLPVEEQPAPFEDHETDEEYPPVREGFYGELIQRFTDGRDDRITSKNYQEILDSDTAFAATLKTGAGRRGIDPMALLAVMDFETGGTFDTGVKNAAGSGATGLIQFMPKTAEALGTTTEELAKMGRVQQMEYVFKYLDQFNVNWRQAEVDDVYMAVLYPAAINKPDGFVLFRSGTTAYEQNAGLDTNGDGTVTKFEAASKVRKRFYG